MINKMLWKLKNIKPQHLSISVLWIVKGYSLLATPLFLFRHALMPMPSWFGSVMVPCEWVEGIKPPFCQWQGSLYNWVEVFCIKVGDDGSLKNLAQRGAYQFHILQWSCYHDSVPWVALVAIQSTIWWHLWDETSISLPNVCNPVDIHSHYTLPEVFTCPQWMLQWMSMGEVIASHWSTPRKSSWPDTGWMSDHHLLMV